MHCCSGMGTLCWETVFTRARPALCVISARRFLLSLSRCCLSASLSSAAGSICCCALWLMRWRACEGQEGHQWDAAPISLQHPDAGLMDWSGTERDELAHDSVKSWNA